jgi:D-sedoheptulose 7-phosphate isomerase
VKKKNHLEELVQRYPELAQVTSEIQNVSDCLVNCFKNGFKVLVCGNGGSCSDSDHIVGELMKGFNLKRGINEEFREMLIRTGGGRGKFLSGKIQQGLPAISLAAHASLISAVINDIDPDIIFAQQVAGYGNPGDVLLGISTSGDARNVIDAAITAKAKGMKVIGLTGETGGTLKIYCDIIISVPESATHLVQELHLPVYHTICLMVEESIFGNS